MHDERREILTILVLLIDEELRGEELFEVHPLLLIPTEHPFQKSINLFMFNFYVYSLVYVDLVHLSDFDGFFREESHPYLPKIPD
jgi:hypothetical protein